MSIVKGVTEDMGEILARSAYQPLPDVEPASHHSVAERMARGRAARETTPRRVHGEWKPSPRRRDPVAVVERESRGRLLDLVPIRYGRMIASPFAFHRGAASVMAADIAKTPTSGIPAQLCGDAHLMNFGVFRTPERSLIFDLNDFDETLPGPWEWDLKRLVASFEIAGRDLGLDKDSRRTLCLRAAGRYRSAMQEFALQTNLDVFHARADIGALLDRPTERGAKQSAVERIVKKSMRRDHLRALERLCEPTDDGIRLKAEPPLLMPAALLLGEKERERYVAVIRTFLADYRGSLSPDRRVLIEDYKYVDIARKVVGVGSVGTRCFVVLMVGRDDDDVLLLQLKEAGRSVLEPHLGPSSHVHHGQRVVEGQRLMQAASDPLLGWYRLRAFDGKTHQYYVRQLWDGKASVDLTTLTAKELRGYADLCGWTLARAHAVSGDRIAIAAYIGDDDELDQSLAAFARSYAKVNERDHAALAQAVADGRLVAEVGV
jgi:uncharacterized protein (DUF2252 family)